jgi:hypothetical protein
LSVLSLTTIVAARAALIANENFANFGQFSQLNSGVTGSDALRGNACVPTSVANGLDFLSNQYNVANLMQAGYGTVNQLITDMGTTAAGTSYPNEVAGIATYIGPGGQNVSPPVQIAGGQVATGFGTVAGFNIQNNTNPTALQMYNWLLSEFAVEFWIAWTGGGAHSLTLYGISIDTDLNGAPTGTGTFSFIDPFGGTPTAGGNNSSAVDIIAASYTTVGGRLFISAGYTAGAGNSTGDPDNPGDSATGFIVTDVAEMVVPEPSTLLLSMLPLGAGILALLRKRGKPGISRREAA